MLGFVKENVFQYLNVFVAGRPPIRTTVTAILLAALSGWGAGPAKAEGLDLLIAAYYPPLMISADGDRPGISIEIVREAARRLGRQTTIEFLPFRRALKTLRHREDALQPALYRLPKREADYQWIAKTHDVLDVFLTLGPKVNTIAEARSLGVIGVETDASMDVLLSSEGFGNLERVDSPEVNAQKLLAGRIDAWALTRSLALWTWRRAGLSGELTTGEPIRSAPVYVVAGLKFPRATADAYGRTIEAMRQDGTIAAILKRYE